MEEVENLGSCAVDLKRIEEHNKSKFEIRRRRDLRAGEREWEGDGKNSMLTFLARASISFSERVSWRAKISVRRLCEAESSLLNFLFVGSEREDGTRGSSSVRGAGRFSPGRGSTAVAISFIA